jgi:hypothetical protein
MTYLIFPKRPDGASFWISINLFFASIAQLSSTDFSDRIFPNRTDADKHLHKPAAIKQRTQRSGKKLPTALAVSRTPCCQTER